MCFAGSLSRLETKLETTRNSERTIALQTELSGWGAAALPHESRQSPVQGQAVRKGWQPHNASTIACARPRNSKMERKQTWGIETSCFLMSEVMQTVRNENLSVDEINLVTARCRSCSSHELKIYEPYPFGLLRNALTAEGNTKVAGEKWMTTSNNYPIVHIMQYWLQWRDNYSRLISHPTTKKKTLVTKIYPFSPATKSNV